MPKKPVIPYEVVLNKIFLIRGQKVMLDMDLADVWCPDKGLKPGGKEKRAAVP